MWEDHPIETRMDQSGLRTNHLKATSYITRFCKSSLLLLRMQSVLIYFQGVSTCLNTSHIYSTSPRLLSARSCVLCIDRPTLAALSCCLVHASHALPPQAPRFFIFIYYRSSPSRLAFPLVLIFPQDDDGNDDDHHNLKWTPCSVWYVSCYDKLQSFIHQFIQCGLVIPV